MSAPATRKSVLVTGGASGIGLAIVRHFAEQGDMVAVLDVNSDGAQVASEVAAKFPRAAVTFVPCDVSSWENQAAAFKQVFEAHGGRLDVAVANAGVSEQGQTSVVDLMEDEPSKPKIKSVDVNLYGVIYCG